MRKLVAKLKRRVFFSRCLTILGHGSKIGGSIFLSSLKDKKKQFCHETLRQLSSELNSAKIEGDI